MYCISIQQSKMRNISLHPHSYQRFRTLSYSTYTHTVPKHFVWYCSESRIYFILTFYSINTNTCMEFGWMYRLFKNVYLCWFLNLYMYTIHVITERILMEEFRRLLGLWLFGYRFILNIVWALTKCVYLIYNYTINENKKGECERTLTRFVS